MCKLTFITASFHSVEWTAKLVSNIRKFTPAERVGEILIIDQDRRHDTRNYLQTLDPLVRVLQYPRSEDHFSVAGHDHPAVLNLAMAEVQSDLCCIFDCDAHPFTSDWLPSCEKLLKDWDALLAADPRYPWVSHPCFALFQTAFTSKISFDEGFLEQRFDSGRLVSEQLKRAGKRPLLLTYKRAFSGRCGFSYLDSIYHHGSGTFGGGDARLRNQVSPAQKFFQRLVIKHDRYQLFFSELIYYGILRRANALWLRLVHPAPTVGKLPAFDGPEALPHPAS